MTPNLCRKNTSFSNSFGFVDVDIPEVPHRPKSAISNHSSFKEFKDFSK